MAAISSLGIKKALETAEVFNLGSASPSAGELGQLLNRKGRAKKLPLEERGRCGDPESSR